MAGGGNFTLRYYDDSGAFLGTALTVTRASGLVSINNLVANGTMSGTLNSTTANTMGSLTITKPSTLALQVLSGTSGTSSSIGVGCTLSEGEIGVASSASAFVGGTYPSSWRHGI